MGLEREGLGLGVDDRLQRRLLAARVARGGSGELAQQRMHGFGGAGRLVRRDERGVRAEAEECRPLGAQPHDLEEHLAVVVRVATRSTGARSIQDPLADSRGW